MPRLAQARQIVHDLHREDSDPPTQRSPGKFHRSCRHRPAPPARLRGPRHPALPGNSTTHPVRPRARSHPRRGSGRLSRHLLPQATRQNGRSCSPYLRACRSAATWNRNTADEGRGRSRPANRTHLAAGVVPGVTPGKMVLAGARWHPYAHPPRRRKEEGPHRPLAAPDRDAKSPGKFGARRATSGRSSLGKSLRHPTHQRPGDARLEPDQSSPRASRQTGRTPRRSTACSFPAKRTLSVAATSLVVVHRRPEAAPRRSSHPARAADLGRVGFTATPPGPACRSSPAPLPPPCGRGVLPAGPARGRVCLGS